MALYAWRDLTGGAGGAFDDPNNWLGPNGQTGLPSAGDTAQFNTGQGPISGSGSVDSINFSGGSWSITGQLAAATVAYSNASIVVGTSGGALVVSGALSVGAAGGLSVVNGGTVSVTAPTTGPGSSFVNANLYVANRGVATFGAGLSFGAASATVTTAVMAVGGVLQLGLIGGAGQTGSLTINGGGQVVLSSATDSSTPYLEVAAGGGSSGSLSVDGATSLLLLANNSGAVGYAGTGTLTVTGGASARFNASANTSNNALNPALTIGRLASGNGDVRVNGGGSSIVAGGSIIVGSAGQGSLEVEAGASVTSVGFVAGQAALAVGAAAGGRGAVSITGSGSSFVATGAAIIGGDNRGSGQVGGGTGSVSVTNGGLLQTGDLTVLAGSTVGVGSGSQGAVGGNLLVAGSLASAGTFVVSGAVYGGGQISFGGGVADIGQLGVAGLAPVSMAFTAPAATVRVHGVVGANTVTSMLAGDEIDLVGNTSVRLAGNVVTTTTGTINLSAAPAGSHYQLGDDGAGGTFLALSVDTIGVYRFFDSNYGTHFFSAAVSEKNTVLATRPDLVYEGVGLQSIDPSSGDPAASNVYRFFDSSYGTHFFTASASERDTVIATRPDLLYEGTGFVEHVAQQPGDVAVYRFFDTRYGTHFYTADSNERDTIVATRPDLVNEGIGFYAPST